MSMQREIISAISCGMFSHPKDALCECRGGGWILSPFDTWHECPFHRGRSHPEYADYEEDGVVEPVTVDTVEIYPEDEIPF